METLVNTLFDLICEHEGFWMTNNDDINGDQHDILMSNDKEFLYMMYENENVKISFSDLISITFENFANMIIATLKIKDKKPLLIHIM